MYIYIYTLYVCVYIHIYIPMIIQYINIINSQLCIPTDIPHDLRTNSSIPAAAEIMCRHCGRYFNPEAAERHIPICANVPWGIRGDPVWGGGSKPLVVDDYSL